MKQSLFWSESFWCFCNPYSCFRL